MADEKARRKEIGQQLVKVGRSLTGEGQPEHREPNGKLAEFLAKGGESAEVQGSSQSAEPASRRRRVGQAMSAFGSELGSMYGIEPSDTERHQRMSHVAESAPAQSRLRDRRPAERRKRKASRRANRAKDEAAPQSQGPTRPRTPADRMREGGYESVRRGLQNIQESGRKRVVRQANPDYAAIKGYTDAMLGEGPIRRRDLFDPERHARARKGLADMFGESRGVPGGPGPGAPPGMDPERHARARRGIAKLAGYDVEDPAQYLEQPAVEEVPYAQGPRDGLLQEQLDANVELATATRAVADAEYAGAQESYDKMAALEQEAREMQERQDAREQERYDAVQEATRSVEQAAQEANDLAAVDPKRMWANAKVGRKIGFVLSAIGLSLQGSTDPFRLLNRYVEEDIEQQRQQHSKAQSRLGNAQAVVDERANQYARAREKGHSERVAFETSRIASMEKIKADILRRNAAAGIQQVSAQQEVLLNKLEQSIAASKARIQSAAARNPEYFVRTAYVHNKGTRDALQRLGEGQIDAGIDAGKRADEHAGRVELKRMDIAQKQQEAAVKADDKNVQEAYKFGQDMQKLEPIIEGIDRLLDSPNGDIPGYGATKSPLPEFMSPGLAATEAEINLLVDGLARLKSGAAIGEDEFEMYSKMLRGGTSLGGEKRLRENLERVKRFLVDTQAAMERGLSREARAYYRRVAEPRLVDFSEQQTGDLPIPFAD